MHSAPCCTVPPGAAGELRVAALCRLQLCVYHHPPPQTGEQTGVRVDHHTGTALSLSTGSLQSLVVSNTIVNFTDETTVMGPILEGFGVGRGVESHKKTTGRRKWTFCHYSSAGTGVERVGDHIGGTPPAQGLRGKHPIGSFTRSRRLSAALSSLWKNCTVPMSPKGRRLQSEQGQIDSETPNPRGN